MLFHLILGITLVSILVHLARSRSKGLSPDRVVRICLLHLLTIQWGLGGVWIAIPHIVVPDTIAGDIGWDPGSPFQVELGFASLGISLLGILAFWFRGKFWIAPVVAQSTFLPGAATVHIQDVLINDNLNPGNAGPILFYDIAIPMIACGLLFAHYRYGGLEDV
jgi:hypothetical protein